MNQEALDNIKRFAESLGGHPAAHPDELLQRDMREEITCARAAMDLAEIVNGDAPHSRCALAERIAVMGAELYRVRSLMAKNGNSA